VSKTELQEYEKAHMRGKVCMSVENHAQEQGEVHAGERRDTQREGKPMSASEKASERKGTHRKRRARV